MTNQSKNTIIYIGGFELPDKNAAAQRVIANGKIFRSLGFNMIYVGIDKAAHAKTSILKTRAEYFGFETWHIAYPHSKLKWLEYLTSIQHLEELITNQHLDTLSAIICYNYPAIAQLKVQQLCKKLNVACIADATEWYGSSGGGAIFNSIKWVDTTLRMRYVHPRAHGIITTSNYLTDYYKHSCEHIVELPTLYDPDVLKAIPARESATNILGFTYAGSPFNVNSAAKNKKCVKERMDFIVKLMFSLHQAKIEFKLDIYGVTYDEYIQVYPDYVNKLENMKTSIRFHGRRPHPEILSSIKSSDFTVFFRDVDRVTLAGFPSKLAESVSCGTPVITNRTPNIEPYIKDNNIGIFVDLDEDGEWIEEITKQFIKQKNIKNSMKLGCSLYQGFGYRAYVAHVAEFLRGINVK